MPNLSGSLVKGNYSGRMATFGGINTGLAFPRCINALKGLSIGPGSMFGDSPFSSNWQVGVSKNTTDGNPSAPCLSLATPGRWRFRWTVQTGTRTISILAKQNSTGSYRPSVIVKTNSNIGLNNDISGSAPAGAGWVTIGPISFVSTGTDVLWVELWNNVRTQTSPALFDHIVTT